MNEDEIKQKAKDTYNFVKDGYDEAEEKVDGWFAKNKYTVAIMSAVAVALVVFGVMALRSLAC